MIKPIPELSAKDIARFWSKVDVRGPDECWPWKAGVSERGYGVISIRQGSFRANRVSLLIDGRDPGELLACHSCDTPRCCNPAHLWVGTSADNNADMTAKGRQVFPRGEDSFPARHPERLPRGDAHVNSKLRAADIPNIRADARVLRIIAEDYGVSQALICLVKSRKMWAHID